MVKVNKIGKTVGLTVVLSALALPSLAQRSVHTFWTEPVTEAGVTWQPGPLFDYTPDGKKIMVKRFPSLPLRENSPYKKFRYLENTNGAAAMMSVLQTMPGGKTCRPLSEEQLKVLREMGEPAYLRGPYKSTRNDFVIEWAYPEQNKLYQFVDSKLAYHARLADVDRIAITYGVPSEVMVSTIAPDIRRETWIYRPVFMSGVGRERVYSFNNGKLIFEQESP